ncbi:MAG: phosphopantetheine-binding protein [Deltaproteobacteria bacterium]|nr:phosphopantetheine-binding protein [Deltaproteobacteria bacterium]MCL5792254.1 phosphopantetheine-binding protein [Deltaproteobacteria bacterium]
MEELSNEKILIGKLIDELKRKVLDILNIQDISLSDIDNNAPLVGNELGIDSIDILELVTVIEKDYGVRIDNKELGQKVFASFASLAQYIYDNRTLI